MSWLLSVPRHLLDRAYRAGGEYAWSRNDAVEVVDALNGRKFRVIGVDIWLPTDPGPTIPTPYVYDWSLDSNRASAGHPGDALDFIRGFDWAAEDSSHRGQQPYFNLTVVALDA